MELLKFSSWYTSIRIRFLSQYRVVWVKWIVSGGKVGGVNGESEVENNTLAKTQTSYWVDMLYCWSADVVSDSVPTIPTYGGVIYVQK